MKIFLLCHSRMNRVGPVLEDGGAILETGAPEDTQGVF